MYVDVLEVSEMIDQQCRPSHRNDSVVERSMKLTMTQTCVDKTSAYALHGLAQEGNSQTQANTGNGQV